MKGGRAAHCASDRAAWAAAVAVDTPLVFQVVQTLRLISATHDVVSKVVIVLVHGQVTIIFVVSVG